MDLETILSDDTIRQEMQKGKVMLFFTAGWCPDCAFIKPQMPAIEAEYADYNWIMVDRDANLAIAQDFGVMGIPSFIALDNGQELGRFVNGDRKTKQEVETFVNSLA